MALYAGRSVRNYLALDEDEVVANVESTEFSWYTAEGEVKV